MPHNAYPGEGHPPSTRIRVCTPTQKWILEWPKAVHKVLQTVTYREEGVDRGTKMVITDRREA